MAAALGTVVSLPGLHSWSCSGKSPPSGCGSEHLYGRRRSRGIIVSGFSSSLRIRRAHGIMKQRKVPLPRLTLGARGQGLQTSPVHRWVCTAGAGGNASRIAAMAIEDPAVLVRKEEDVEKTDYNWRTEWYPLYLTNEIPRDAPLALRVYDQDLVLFYDGRGELNCLEDCCPHRAAKLSDGQVIDGTLECLYHGWQFKGDGACVKIPQLSKGAVIPRKACARSYAIKISQEVVWVWMADKSTADESKIPFFENYELPGYVGRAAIHEFPYDHSILVENLLDPAHVHISHDRTDFSARREKAEALKFEVLERSARGFAATVAPASDKNPIYYRFQAPSIIQNDKFTVDKDGISRYFGATFLIRPTGQGKCCIIIRFGGTAPTPGWLKLLPRWVEHMIGAKVFEEDMIFLAAQNETLIRKGLPTEEIYLNLGSSDTMVMEYRKWLDKVGQGMPYYFGHKTVANSPIAAVQERAPAGMEAYSVSTQPSKGAFVHLYSRDTTNRYFRHIVHCKTCRTSLNEFRQTQKICLVLTAVFTAVAIMLSNSKWKAALVIAALCAAACSWASGRLANLLTQNFIRPQREH